MQKVAFVSQLSLKLTISPFVPLQKVLVTVDYLQHFNEIFQQVGHSNKFAVILSVRDVCQ